jgi:fluoride exporter
VTGFALVCLGAAIGAPLRHLVGRWVRRRTTGPVPWGTIVVNVVGSFVLGLAVGLAGTYGLPDEVLLAVGTGLCGALTTFSTFGLETVRLREEGEGRAALVNVVGSVVLALAAVTAGVALGRL